MENKLPRLLTVPEVCKLLRVCRKTLDRMHDRGELRKRKRGPRSVVYLESDVIAFMEGMQEIA